jgi:hypothetical protein
LKGAISDDVNQYWMNASSLLNAVTTIFESTIRMLYEVDVTNKENNKKKILKPCRNSKYDNGDYQCSVVMTLFQSLCSITTSELLTSPQTPPVTTTTTPKLPKQGLIYTKSPYDIANAIIHSIRNHHPIITDLKIHDPGVIITCRLRLLCLQQYMLMK